MRDAVPQKGSTNLSTPKSKPSLEIYRPPGLYFLALGDKCVSQCVIAHACHCLISWSPLGGRAEGTTANVTNLRLNVHAKEFTMKQNDSHLSK